MKKLVLCLAIMMAIGVVAVGCSKEKKEEVKPSSMVEEGVNKVTEAVPAMEDHAQPPAEAASDMGQMGHEAAPEAAAPVEGMVQSSDAAVEGSAMVQEGAAMVEEGAAMVKEGAAAVEGAVGEEAGAHGN